LTGFHERFRATALTLALIAALAGAAVAETDPAGWVEVDYGALVDTRALSHSGEPVGVLLNTLGGRPAPRPGERAQDRLAHALLDPLLEPYAFVMQDALDTVATAPDPPFVEVGSLWQPGERQPAWTELLRARRFLVESDGAGSLRLILPVVDATEEPTGDPRDAARSAWVAAWPILRHVLAAERRRLGTDSAEPVTLQVEVHAYHHARERTRFVLGVEPYKADVDDTRSDGRRPPLDLAALEEFLDSGMQLEGARLEQDGTLRVLASRSSESASMLGRPIGLADFAVAYRAVFEGGLAEPYMSLDRGFSPQSSLVNYGGRLRDTSLGMVSLLCDIRFKTFSLGIDIVSGEDVREQVRGNLPSFRTHLERFAEDERSAGVQAQQTRLWFYPDAVDLTVSAQTDVLVMRRVRMSAASERIRGETLTSAEGDDAPWTRETVLAINEDYDALAASFPELASLDQVVRLLSFFSWLRQAESVGLLLPDLSVLLALELPELYTPRTFPQLLAFNALPAVGDGTAVASFDRVAVGDALERLGPRGTRQLEARQRFDRAVAALDRENAQQAALLDELSGYDVDRLDEGTLDLLVYRAERLRMHEVVLSTLDREHGARLAARQQSGERLRIFSVGIGGLDLGMNQAVARATGRSLQLGLGAQSARLAVADRAEASPGANAARRPAQPPREDWRNEPALLPTTRLPDHGLAGEPSRSSGALRMSKGHDEVLAADGTATRRAWFQTVTGVDDSEIRSRKVFVDGKGRATEFDRFEDGRRLVYRVDRKESVLRARPLEADASAPASDEVDGAVLPPPGLVRLNVEGGAGADPSKLRLRLELSREGVPRQLEADFPRPVLQRLVMGRTVDATPSEPMPLAPLPPAMGAMDVVMFQIGSAQLGSPWESGATPVPGEEDPVRLARALNRWSRTGPPEQAAPPAVAGADPLSSPQRWSDAPLPGGGGLLLLPSEGFRGEATALRDALERGWEAGPVADELPAEIESPLVVMVSNEPPSICASRLRRLSGAPVMKGKLLAGWCLAGEMRPDIPASLINEGALAGFGIAGSTIFDLRNAPEALAEFGQSVTNPLHAGSRVEQLGGPFLWFF
jgi:hypothetical protein